MILIIIAIATHSQLLHFVTFRYISLHFVTLVHLVSRAGFLASRTAQSLVLGF